MEERQQKTLGSANTFQCPSWMQRELSGHSLKVPTVQKERGQLMYAASSKAMFFLPGILAGLLLKMES